ncbi:MAG: HU family DNA-binding protein [Paludibacteraceae bacterium]|nr:HU family DNA-binding protein [Paludibacteraceae bacterium]
MNEKLTLQDVTDKLAARIGVTKKVSDDFLREFFALIVDSLAKDGLVKIKGLGTFKLKSVEERKSVNVQTGAEMVIPAHVKVTYTPDKGLSSDINKPYAHLQTYILDQDGPIEDSSYVDDDESDSDDMEKIDNSIFVNNSDEGDSLNRYYFNDELVLADQREDATTSSNETTPSVEDSKEKSDSSQENEEIQSILEAQPQEGQVVSVFTEQGSVIGTPSINPGPVVTLLMDDSEEEKSKENVGSTDENVDAPISDNEPKEQVPEKNEKEEVDSIVEENKIENGSSLASDGNSSQSSSDSSVDEENVGSQEDGELEEKKETEDAPVDQNNNKRQSTNLIGLLILVLLLLLLGLIGYLYKDELKSALSTEEKVEEVLPPVVQPSDSSSSTEEEEIYDDRSDSHVSGGVVQHSDEGTLDEQPVVEGVAEESQYSFAPELVQYMKENHPSEDISISSIKDEVNLTSGRRLVDLSLKYYGHKYFWVYIYFFNTDVIKDPNKLVPGTLIKIPELSSSLVNKDDRQKLDMAFEIKKLIEK